jgi:hypothetical protein
VLEQIELQVPIRLLCREECRGLCPQCGADWNAEQCTCPPAIDPRWESLAGLRPVEPTDTDADSPDRGGNRQGRSES